MTFHPRMTSRIEGVSVIGGLKWRSWAGVVADVWSVKCEPEARGEYISEDPRLFVVLDKCGGGTLQLGTDKASDLNSHGIDCPMSFIPAGLPVWGRLRKMEYLRHLDIHFDLDIIRRRFGDDLITQRFQKPRLMFSDDAVAGLARLIADECVNEQPLNDLYGDSLVTALVVQLFQIGQARKRQRSQLSARHLRLVTAYIEEHSLRTIRLQELSDLTGLSQSYFSHAFKASTGMAPHQWQMKARIRKVQSLLGKKGASLTTVASLAGFSDQAHLTRVFKRVVGVTPAVWQREQWN
ncbi:AraC family transcriptional regulator [Phyllobacterium sp. 0TCS1.6C]|uniref:helix-turn-helix domain-containing protein n=1 Tax=unclassified Phyllobacterium TaxID=2638441 RepID=UPI0022655608|nr:MULTISPECIES: AraC family transcriptional regulator [unclassified Phyllobacterium]MCX8279783.1 AraC family transcriptional regulator [Phyllobacterium sp. 0TCS1.6C]MCX8295613.1 AraC family transcriptional regulator [Phyllobacterium sp. 0TCS1.6A]